MENAILSFSFFSVGYFTGYLVGPSSNSFMKGVLRSLAVIGLFISCMLLVVASFLMGATYGYGVSGGVFILTMSLLIGSASLGVLCGSFSYSLKTSLSRMKALAAVPFIIGTLVPIYIVSTNLSKQAAKQAILADNIKRMQKHWEEDIVLKFGEHFINIPISPRVSLGVSTKNKNGEGAGPVGFGVVWSADTFNKRLASKTSVSGVDRFVANLSNDAAKTKVYRVQISGFHNNEDKKDNLASPLKSVNSWCGIRKNMQQSFWCQDGFNGLYTKFLTDSAINFENRKYWFEHPDEDFSGNFSLSRYNSRYKESDFQQVFWHDFLGRDKRMERFLSICRYKKYDKNRRICRLEYAIEKDILVETQYEFVAGQNRDDVAKKQMEIAEKIWSNLVQDAPS